MTHSHRFSLASLGAALVLATACEHQAPAPRVEPLAVRPAADVFESEPLPSRGLQPIRPRTLRTPRAHASRAATAGLTLEVYDVRDLVAPRTTFLAPRIGALPSGEDEFRSGGEGEEREPFVSPDMLVTIVQEATGPEYWTETDGASIDVSEEGFLLVRAHPQVHARIGLGLRAAR